MPGKDNQDKRDRKESSNSKLRIKRSRRRIYNPLPEGTSSAGSSEGGPNRMREETLQRKIRQMHAKHMVKNYVIGAMGAGLVPIPADNPYYRIYWLKL